MVMKKEIPWDLIVSKLKNELTAEEEKRLNDWLPDHAELFDELAALWDKIQLKSMHYNPDADYYWNELSRRMHGETTKSKHKDSAHLEPKRHRQLSQWTYWAAACAIVVIIASFFAGQWMGVPEAISLEYACVSGKSSASLPDRSLVWLHNDTKLVCNVTQQGGKERIVSLEGEAYFDVAHDEDRPFVVQTEGMTIRVHGTKFNVEAFPETENTYVSLVEGSVSLETATEHRYLMPGETATYDRKYGRLSIAADDVVFASSWMQEQIVFEQRSLRDICRFLSKWYHVKITLEPAIADKFRYTFTLRNESLEEILRLMTRINPIEYTFNDENELTIFNKSTNTKK